MMLLHFGRVFLKFFGKNKISNLVNLIGLTVGMMAAMVVAKYLGYSLSVNNFHQNLSQIYQLQQTEMIDGQVVSAGDGTYRGVAIETVQAIPEVTEYTRVDPQVEMLVTAEKDDGVVVRYNEPNIWAVDTSFLKIFSFPLILGSQNKIFANHHVALLTRKTATKYFGHQNPVGRSLSTRASWGEKKQWVITGVLENPPPNSSIQFDILLYNSQEEKLWDNPVYNQYILTTAKSDRIKIARKLSNYLSELPPFHENNRSLIIHLQSLSPELSSLEFLLALTGIGILALSWINFINLSIAQSLTRMREVLIRKALGSSRKQLLLQFAFESLCMNCLAFLFGFLLLRVIYPVIEDFTGYHLLPLFNNQIHINTAFTIIFVLGSVVTSSYPAIFLTSKKIDGMPSTPQMKDRRGMQARKGLVVIQLTVSSMMLMGFYVISSQMHFMLHQDLGFDPDNKIILKPPKDSWEGKQQRMQTIKNELEKLGWIEKVTSSSTIPGESYRHEVSFSLAGTNHASMLYQESVDTSFMRAYQLQWIAGSGFSSLESNSTLNSQVILNETACQLLGLSAQEALGKILTNQEDGEEYYIRGVTRNLHKLSLRDQIEPTIYTYNPRRGYLTLLTVPDNTISVQTKIAQLKALWQTVYQDQPFEYFFLNEQYRSQYEGDLFFQRVFNFFTLISVLLACLGLIGLSLFEATSAQMEVGIRKTFGATTSQILYRYLKKYLLLVLLALGMGVPIANYLLGTWLQEYSFRIHLEIAHLLVPSLLLWLVVTLTISFQFIKLSLLNPAQILRDH